MMLMNEAIITLSSHWGLLPGRHFKKWALTTHISLESMSFIFITLGFLSIYFNKENNNKAHFTSWHGLIGIAAILILTIQTLLGVVARYPRVVVKLDANWWKTLHIASGIFITLVTIASLVSGCFSSWFASQAGILNAYICSCIFLSINTFTSVRALTANRRISSAWQSFFSVKTIN